jgi:hypothetical protein
VVSLFVFGRLTPGEDPRYPWVGNWDGLAVDLDAAAERASEREKEREREKSALGVK